jgi:exodeoxyribonuclease VII small subunit
MIPHRQLLRIFPERNDKMSFEKDLARLNDIVKQLESSELTLEESLDLYKEGVDLSVNCKKTLEQAKLTVIKMNEGNEDE